jgi:protein-S-isoprenylcysteine O-methyltransferase Ste14
MTDPMSAIFGGAGSLGIICSFVGLLLGMVIGRYIEGRRWRRNAEEVQRVLSKGYLYKVTRE